MIKEGESKQKTIKHGTQDFIIHVEFILPRILNYKVYSMLQFLRVMYLLVHVCITDMS